MVFVNKVSELYTPTFLVTIILKGLAKFLFIDYFFGCFLVQNFEEISSRLWLDAPWNDYIAANHVSDELTYCITREFLRY